MLGDLKRQAEPPGVLRSPRQDDGVGVGVDVSLALRFAHQTLQQDEGVASKSRPSNGPDGRPLAVTIV